MRFKTGDIVRVKEYEDINISPYENGHYFASNMRKYCGKSVTIVCIKTQYGNRYKYYNIKENNEHFGWLDEWLEPVEPEFQLGEELFII